MGKLNAVDLTRLPDGNHFDGQGLMLQVRGNSRAWILRYSIAGKDRYLGLGSLKDISLKQARLDAGAKRREIDAARKGERGAVDPVDDRKRVRQEQKAATRKAKTFKQAALDYIADNESKWSSGKHRWQWGRTLELYVYPAFGGIAVGEIERAHVLAALRPIWREYPETARRLRGRIETVLAYAEANEWRAAGSNPAAQKPIAMALGDQDSVVRKRPALPYSRMAEFMAELRTRVGLAARALEFQILTTTRGRETVEAKWSEVDWSAKTWTVPAARMKGRKGQKRAHLVPLSPAALALLRLLYDQRSGDAIFGVSVEAMEKVIRTMNAKRAKLGLPLYGDAQQEDRPVVPHGVARASFRTWVSECTDFPREVAEKALAHLVGDETERAYDRGDLLQKRAKLMDAWAAHCEGPVRVAKARRTSPQAVLEHTA